MEVLVNPIRVLLRKTQHENAHLMGDHVCDAVAVGSGEVVGYLLLEVQKASTQLHMKLKDHCWYVTLDDPEHIRSAVNVLAARLNLVVDWEAMDAS